MAILGEAHIFIVKALEIINETGGTIECTPGEVRRWRVKNDDCTCESVSLTRASANFVQDYNNRQKGILD